MRKFAGKVETKSVPFLDGELEIRKLNAGQIKKIGKLTKELKGDAEDLAFEELLLVFKEAVVLEAGEDPLTVEVLESFSFDTLKSLSTHIMEYAGVAMDGDLGNAS